MWSLAINFVFSFIITAAVYFIVFYFFGFLGKPFLKNNDKMKSDSNKAKDIKCAIMKIVKKLDCKVNLDIVDKAIKQIEKYEFFLEKSEVLKYSAINYSIEKIKMNYEGKIQYLNIQLMELLALLIDLFSPIPKNNINRLEEFMIEFEKSIESECVSGSAHTKQGVNYEN